MTRKQSLRVTNLIKSGFTRNTVRRKIRQEKIKISTQEFNKKWNKFSTKPVLIKRFMNARRNTKITSSYFTKSKNPDRLKNVYVITVVLKITNSKSGISSEGFFSIGYNKVKTKGEILEAIQDLILEFIKDSPLLDIEFIKIEAMVSKKGRF